MKSIAIVNTALPKSGDEIEYCSGESLRDYDIILFSPAFPSEHRVDFTGGGSCLSIESTRRIQSAISHWKTELKEALKAGKTVFVLLSESQDDLGASSSSADKKQRTYHTFHLNNYNALPVRIGVRNTKGRKILVVDNAFRGLYDVAKEVATYRAILEPEAGRKIYAAKDDASVASIIEVDNLPGKMVLLPHFDLIEYYNTDTERWSAKALQISKRIAGQLIAVDELFQKRNGQTPPPEWLENAEKPKKAASIDKTIEDIDARIEALKKQREKEIESKDSLLEFSHLLYENGKALESVVERSLQLLGYNVENYRFGDLEIDHIITRCNGIRMIGESEGRDTSAVDISKFRQLESNINEDFQRDDVAVHAKGILFGNGFRFTPPDRRNEQFTVKCLANARRLGTALIRTTDLYKVVVHIIDHPSDEKFKAACQQAIERTAGEIVKFPISIDDRCNTKRRKDG